MEIIDVLLTTEGNNVTKTMDGEECLNKYMAEMGRRVSSDIPPFDLLVVDWAMPKRNGDSVIREILKLEPHQKILMMTAFPKEATILLGDLSQKLEIIHKPFELDTFIEKVNSFK